VLKPDCGGLPLSFGNLVEFRIFLSVSLFDLFPVNISLTKQLLMFFLLLLSISCKYSSLCDHRVSPKVRVHQGCHLNILFKIRKSDFKNQILGGATISKMLIFYYISPIFFESYKFDKISHLKNQIFDTKKSGFFPDLTSQNQHFSEKHQQTWRIPGVHPNFFHENFPS
jgi:hypothetical protein